MNGSGNEGRVTEADTAANIRRHFEKLGDADAGHEIYSEDAVMEFAHTGERLVGRANIEAARRAYPGPPVRFEVRRVVCTEDHGVVEMTLRFEADEPHHAASVLDLREGKITGERRYITEPTEAPAYRTQWTSITP
jgi:hypothetical protein